MCRQDWERPDQATDSVALPLPGLTHGRSLVVRFRLITNMDRMRRTLNLGTDSRENGDREWCEENSARCDSI